MSDVEAGAGGVVAAGGQVLVDEDLLREVVAWWRNANEAPGGCSALDAIRGMKDAVWQIEMALRDQTGKAT